MPIKFIGRTTDFRGKTLWEIVGNLKNFGVGRIVTRSRFERYPEPTFMKIMKVEALPNPKNPSLDDLRKVRVVVEKTFRGMKHTKPITIESTSYKTDYRLIPRDEEADYCKTDIKESVTVLPKFMPFPPLLRELVIQEAVRKGEKAVEPKMELVYRKNSLSKYRIAEDGEKPSFELGPSIARNSSSSLYKNVKA